MSVEFWILDGKDKTYFHKGFLKSSGCFWEKSHSSWVKKNPDNNFISAIKTLGLKIQKRRILPDEKLMSTNDFKALASGEMP